MSQWFPRFNPSGSKLTWEQAPSKYQAQWITEDVEIWHDGLHLVIAGIDAERPAFNLLAAGGGRWAGFRTDPVRVERSWDLPLIGAGDPAMDADGTLAYTHPYSADQKSLYMNGATMSIGAIADVRLSRQALVWTDAGKTWGFNRLTSQVAKLQVAQHEYRPIPIDTPDGPWVLNHTQTGIILRPFNTHLGHRFDNDGQCYFPDAVYLNGQIDVVFTNDRGVPSRESFSLDKERVDLRTPTQQPATLPEPRSLPRRSGVVEDLIVFVRGEPSAWPRSGPGHPMHQHDAGDLFHFVKFGMVEAYETWAVDKDWIYLLEDASGSTPSRQPYHFTDPRWFPRRMAIGSAHAFVTGAHRMITTCRGSCEVIADHDFSRRMWIEAVYPRYWWGPDLGERETLVVAYDPTGGVHIPERGVELGYFARGAGSVRWEWHRSDLVYSSGDPVFSDATRGGPASDFYLLGGMALVPKLSGCVAQRVPTQPPRPAELFPRAQSYEVTMSTERVGLRGPIGDGKFLRVVPGTLGQGPFKGYKLEFDADQASGDAEFELSKPDGKFQIKSVPHGVILGTDATMFGADVGRQFYTSGGDVTARGGYESWIGAVQPNNLPIMFVEFDQDGRKFVGAALTVVKL